MTREYVIDGTNIITTTEDEPSLTPLLQLLLLLTNRKDNFYCYFDADTRYKIKDDTDRQLYQNLIKFGLSEFFIQVSGLDADAHILKQANSIGAKIITNDNFASFAHDLEEASNKNWLIPVKVEKEILIVEELGIKKILDQPSIIMLTQLVNQLESERNTSHGVIDKFKVNRDFGFIRRTLTNKKLFFHKDDVKDEKLDYTVSGKEVSYQIGIGEARGIYYFCAKNVKEKGLEDPKIQAQTLAASNKLLEESKSKIQQQNAEIKAALDQQIVSLTTKNERFLQENIALKEELELFKSTDNEVIKRLEKNRTELVEENEGLNDEIKMLNEVISQKDREMERLRAEIEHLKRERDESIVERNQQKTESNELAFTIDFQQEKIEDLDEDLKSTLRLVEIQDLEGTELAEFEQLKKDYHILNTALKQKNARIIFLTNNINDLEQQLTLNTNYRTGKKKEQDTHDLLERIQELERTNRELTQKVEKISTQNISADGERVSDEAEPKPAKNIKRSRPTKQKEVPKPVDVKEIPEQELINWWNGLEEQWKKAFNQAVLSRGELLTRPTFEQLRSLFERQKIDIVGSGILLFGLNQLSFKLNDLSGLADLKQVTELNLSGHEFTEMKGIEKFQGLELLNCTSNKITSLRNIKKLQNLKTLIIRDNELINLDGVEDLEELEYLNALYNQGLRSIAGVEELERLQVLCVPSYKTKIIRQLEKLHKINPTIEVRNV